MPKNLCWAGDRVGWGSRAPRNGSGRSGRVLQTERGTLTGRGRDIQNSRNNTGKGLRAWQAWCRRGLELRARAAEPGYAGPGHMGWIPKTRDWQGFYIVAQSRMRT